MIYLVRHGQSTTNALGLLVGRSNPALTDLGRAQARSLRPWLADVAMVWSSPLQRAHETARLGAPHLEPTIVEALIEVDYGSLDGTPLADVSEEAWQRFESDHAYPMGNGESLEQVDQRVHPLLDGLLADRDSLLHQSDRHLLIVSHVSPIKSALAWALGVPGSVAWRTRIDNGSFSVLAMRRRSPQLVRANVVPPLVEDEPERHEV
jgi:probable phosphoglycerate mutase